LSDDQLGTHDETVGLPQALQAAKALGPATDAELRALLTSKPDLRRDT
jgi:hypothetical protein